MNKFVNAAIFAGSLVTFGVAVLAAPADVIASRQQSFKQIGKANKGIMDELKSGAPSIANVRANADQLASLAPQITRWFPRGSGPEAGVKTSALPVIWQRTPEFVKDAAALNNAVKTLRAAAASGDVARITAAMPAVGAACKACHETFRARTRD